jgi:hypothetical protein
MPSWARDDEARGIRNRAFRRHFDVLVPVLVSTPESAAVEEEVLMACQQIAAGADEIARENERGDATKTPV